MATLLSINNYYYPRGGAEVVFLEHSALFEELGWQVVPFAMQYPKNLETRWSENFVQEIEFGAAYSTWDKIKRAPMVVYSIEARKRLGKLIDSIRPDICHAHNIYHHISPSILGLLKKKGVPVVITLHDLKIACPAYKMLTHDGICERCKGGRLYNVVVHRCIKESRGLSALVMLEALIHTALGSYRSSVDRFVVPSQFYIQKFVEWGWSPNRFVYIPNFVNIAAFQPCGEVGRAFLYFGRLAEEKGVATLIRAASAAKVSLMVAGAGPQKQRLIELARSLDADVSFLGVLAGDRLHEAIRSSRAVVLPSEWYENAPMSIVESYALGKPVIGAAVGGIPELIKEGETGIFFESGSVDSLREALEQFQGLSEKTLADMGLRARMWVEREFSRETYRRRILQLYRELDVPC